MKNKYISHIMVFLAGTIIGGAIFYDMSDYRKYKTTLAKNKLTHDELISVIGQTPGIKKKMEFINNEILVDNIMSASISLMVLNCEKKNGNIEKCRDRLNKQVYQYLELIEKTNNPSKYQLKFKNNYLKYIEK